MTSEAAAETGDNTESSSVRTSVEHFNADWRFYLIFFCLSIISLAAALDATSLSVALPIMAAKLHGTAIEAFWAGTSFLLASTVVMPSFCSFSHIFGRKPLLMTTIILFFIGSIISAMANNFASLLVGRTVQGVGAGGVISLTEVILTDLVPLSGRGKWYGLISAVWAVGSVSGPIIGGVFAQSVSWIWIFWVNVPILCLGLIFCVLFLKLQMTRNESFQTQLCRIDWIGTILFIGSTTSLLIPVTWGGIMFSWSSPKTLAPFIIGLIGLAAFGPYEYFFAKEPMVRLSIFNTVTARIVFLQTFIHGVCLWSLLYYGPFFFEGVRGYSPIISGVAMFPETFTIAPAAAVVGILVAYTGKYRWALWTGWILTTVGLSLLYLEKINSPTLHWVTLNLVPGVGMGMLFTSMAMAVPAACNPIDMAHAAAFLAFCRSFGNSVGVAIGGAVFQNQFKKNLESYPLLKDLAGKYSQDAAALVEIIKFMDKSLMKDQLIQAYADSLRIVWMTMAALAGVALASNFWIKSYSLEKILLTEQGFLRRDKPKDVEKAPTEEKSRPQSNVDNVSEFDYPSNHTQSSIDLGSSDTANKIEIVKVCHDDDKDIITKKEISRIYESASEKN
ncbi:Efflux pump FUS6 [Golovinomyces cichoracearum]|uniref:Efflux pump FUS6 n=1 Tax=Golovinomyces cichoracearum TaxID=62708 RepID=A0A420HCH2_9PEZI|nr:Efflux pump FUS6 [Golovinomyces cichoracearum]